MTEPKKKYEGSKGPRATFTPCGKRYPGICFLEGAEGVKTYYARYIRRSDKSQHFEKIGTSTEGWTPAKVADVRAERRNGDETVKTNLEQREAAKAAAEAKARAIAEDAVTDETTFGKYAAAWLERVKPNLAQSTYRDYKSAFKVYVTPHLGEIPFKKINHKIVEDLVVKININGISGKRKNNVMVPLKKLFSDAVQREDLDASPAEKIKRAKEEKPVIDPLSFPEMKAFLENVDAHYRTYFTAAFMTGMRPSELIALKWSNVDLVMRTITVREGRVQGIEGPPKTDSSNRDVDILAPLYEVLRKHRRETPADAHYVFTTKKGGPLEVNNLRNDVWYPTLEKAKLRDRAMYQTRHTFASLMLKHGEDPLWVSRTLGHSTLAMVYKHYGKFIRDRERKDGAKFVREFGKTKTPKALVAAENATVETEVVP